MKVVFALLLVVFSLCCSPGYGVAAEGHKHVLVLLSYDIRDQWSADVLDGIASSLSSVDAKLHVESLDSRRHHGDRYLDEFERFLVAKYTDFQLDLAIAADNDALDFMMRYRAELQPDLPIVFCGINNFSPDIIAGHAAITGVNEAVDIPGTVNLALDLFPEAETLVAVGGSEGVGAVNLDIFRQSIPAFSRDVEVLELVDVPRTSLSSALSALPPDSILLRLDNLREPDGSSTPLQQSIGLLSAVAPGPVFSCWDFDMGHGALGGVLVHGFAQGTKAGELAALVLQGRSINSIPVVLESPNALMLDYRQLARHDVKDTSLPDDAVIINEPVSVYSRHKKLIWTVAGVGAFMAGSIIVLAFTLVARRKAEKALRDSEQRYRTYVDNAPAGIFIADSEGRYTDVNPAACRLTGYDRDELLSMSVPDLFSPDTVDYAMAAFATMKAEGRVSGEMDYRRKNGEVRLWSLLAARISEDRYLGFVNDVTDRRREEEARNIFLELLENTEHIVVFKDPDLRYVMVNNAYTTLTGYGIEDIAGKTDDAVFAGLSTPEQIETYMEYDRQALSLPPGRSLTVEEDSLAPDGSVRTFLSKKFPVYSEGDRLLGAGTITWEITDRKRAEDALQASEERYRLIFQNSPISLWEQDFSDVKRRLDELRATGVEDVFDYFHSHPKELAEMVGSVKILDVNQATLDMYETPTKEHLYNGLLDIFEDDALETFMECLRPVIEEGRRSVVSERTHRTLSGKRLYVQLYWSLAPGHEEHWTRVLAALVDITPVKNAEKALIRAMNEAEEANKAKSVFLANMSHELRTPLNGVMGMLQLVGTSTLDPENADYIEKATESCRRLTRLLGDILDLSRIEAGKMEVHRAPFDFMDTIEAVRRLFDPVARQTGLDLLFETDPHIPPTLEGDASRLQQVLGNIIGNALKFTSEGSVTVSAYAMPALREGERRVLFAVRDTGIGIPDAMLNKLFEPFTQAEASYTRTYQGAGLGLSIVKRLVLLMDGVACIMSEERVGTTFFVCLPFGLTESRIRQEPDASHPAPLPAGVRTILLAEDDRVSALVVIRQLEKLGCTVTAVEDGRQTLAALAEDDYDLLLLDIQMPEMDGVEAARRIRAGEAGDGKAGIPIIALTAYAMDGDKEHFFDAGMNGYLAKPVEMDALLAAIEEVAAPPQE